ncbi:hypothetical protein MKW94_022268 [Papaver nudicaule]|uniref:Transcription initiation factor IIA gamma subunit C-terminal domain-containing protein n=1 Tax=Papaver nudicaule TaxID=74823 RepID=A0AA41VY75_PAPNU|nr:hypothetical protein [Papaver nudicaule]
MVSDGTLCTELANQSVTEALRTQVKAKPQSRLGFCFLVINGHLCSYNKNSDVWLLTLKHVLFNNEEHQENAGKVKIVACNSKLLTQ